MKPLTFNRTLVIRSLVLAHDATIGGLAFLIGLVLTDTRLLQQQVLPWNIFTATALFMAATAMMTISMGLHRGLWRYSSVSELVAIINATAVITIGFAGLDVFFGLFKSSSKSVSPAMIVAGALMILGMGGTRLAYRLWRNRRVRVHKFSGTNDKRSRVILIGTTVNTDLFIKATLERVDLKYEVVSVLDDRNRRSGLSIRGVPIVGDLKAIKDLHATYLARGRAIDGFVLTKRYDAYPQHLVEALINYAAETGLELLRLPEFSEMSTEGDDGRLAPQPLKIEDLLNRQPVKLDMAGLRDLMTGDVVLVTGAGGSIGSELCRQILRFSPRKIVLVELSEFALYLISQELNEAAKAQGSQIEIVPLLGDVRDRAQMQRLMKSWTPSLVFHAAALKHVPIVEAQPLEGLHTNLIGTRNVADAACACGVLAMVILSTDKAVRPTSVMGAAKRLAEIYCQSLDLQGNTRFITVRFGNVLGSTGSVVPLFHKQIAAGGPITVTHPDVSRYFMTIPEACQLVLHAMQYALGRTDTRGRIHALDMGVPVKIVDLARRMIILSGLRPDVDIEIAYTGLRPGEKMHEELFTQTENPTGTAADGIIVGFPPTYPMERSAAIADRIEAAISANDTRAAMAELIAAVPESLISADKPTEPSPSGDSDAEKVVPIRRVR